MAPRGRKPRLRRMDAAIDAMELIGFPKPLVVRVVNDLLKVYDKQWTYIEECSYKLVIEVILDGQEKSNQEKDRAEVKLMEGGESSNALMEGGESSNALMKGGESSNALMEGGESSNVSNDLVILPPEQIITIQQPVSNPPQNRRVSNPGWLTDSDDEKDEPVHKFSPIRQDEKHQDEVKPMDDENDKGENLPQKKDRRHCNGWLSRDDNSVPVESSLILSQREFDRITGRTERKRKLNSRWDVMPLV